MAVHSLSRALELTPEDEQTDRYRLLLAREAIYDVQGDRPAQQDDLAMLKRLGRALDDDQKRTEIALREARYHDRTGAYSDAITAVKVAIDLSETARAEAHLTWGRALWRLGSLQDARFRKQRESLRRQVLALPGHQIPARSASEDPQRPGP